MSDDMTEPAISTAQAHVDNEEEMQQLLSELLPSLATRVRGMSPGWLTSHLGDRAQLLHRAPSGALTCITFDLVAFEQAEQIAAMVCQLRRLDLPALAAIYTAVTGRSLTPVGQRH